MSAAAHDARGGVHLPGLCGQHGLPGLASLLDTVSGEGMLLRGPQSSREGVLEPGSAHPGLYVLILWEAF